jgi:hypothetical protein
MSAVIPHPTFAYWAPNFIPHLTLSILEPYASDILAYSAVCSVNVSFAKRQFVWDNPFFADWTIHFYSDVWSFENLVFSIESVNLQLPHFSFFLIPHLTLFLLLS